MATTLTDPKTGKSMPFASENATDYKVALASGYVPTPGVLATQVGNAGTQSQNIQTATYDNGKLVSQTGADNPASYAQGTTQTGGLTSWQDISPYAGDNNVSSHYDANLGTWVAGPDPNSQNTMTGQSYKNTAIDPNTGISTQTGSGQIPTFEWTPGNKEQLTPQLIAKALAATKSGDTSGYWQTVLGQAQHYGMINLEQAFSSNPATYTPGMISSETARNASNSISNGLNQMDGDAASVFAQQQKTLQDRYNQDAASLQAKNDAEQIATGRAQEQENNTLAAAQFKTGRTGTLYGAAEMNQLAEVHRQELQTINNKYLDLTTQAKRALEDGNVQLAQQYKQAAATEISNAKTSQAAFDAHQKAILDLNKQATDQADSTIDNILNAGIEPDASMLSALDKKFGLDNGSSALLYASAASVKKMTDAKTQTEAQTAAVDGAKKLQEYLDSRPVGEPVNIAGVTYIGTGKGDIKKGVEIDKKTGRGVYYEFNPADPTHPITMDMGALSSPADGNWTVKENPIDHSLWRVDADTGRMEKMGGASSIGGGVPVPLEPGQAQKTFNKLLPEGSTPPCRPGGEAYQGQCASYANWAYGEGVFGSTIQQKTAKLAEYDKVNPQEIQTNMTFVQKAGTTGHVGLVGDVVRDPKTGAITGFYANESNMVPPYGEKVSYSRFVKIDDAKLVGFADIPTPNLPAIGGDSKVANTVNQSQNGWATGTDTEKLKPLGFDELAKINKTLPSDKQLPYGSTADDAASAGATPGASAPSTPGEIDEQTAKELTLMPSKSQEEWKNTSDRDRLVARQLVNGDSLLEVVASARATANGTSADSERMRLNKLALTLDPKFSSTDNTNMVKFTQGWNDSKGRAYAQRVAANTALNHMAELKKWSDQLQNTDFMKANSVANAIATNINSPGQAEAVQNFDYAAELLAHEIAAFYKGTASPTDSDVKEQRDKINSMKPKDISKSLINLQMNMMAGKISEQGEEYEKVMHKFPEASILNPDSIKSLKSAGLDTSHLEDLVMQQSNLFSDTARKQFDEKMGATLKHNPLGGLGASLPITKAELDAKWEQYKQFEKANMFAQ